MSHSREGLRQLGLQAVYRAPGANLNGSALHDSSLSNDENIPGRERVSEARCCMGQYETRETPK